MKIAVLINENKIKAKPLAQRFITLLSNEGVDCLSNNKFDNCHFVDEYDSIIAQCDIVSVFGGDGTILSHVNFCAKLGKPILAINVGNMGFLTQAEDFHLEDIVKSLVAGNYSVIERNMLSIDVDDSIYTALNEVVVSGKDRCHAVKIDLAINDCKLGSYIGDGIIVCSAIGSTAYSFAAGGPVLNPQLAAMVVTPLCAHTSNNVPIVTLSDDVVKLQCQSLQIYVDGKIVCECANCVTVTESRLKALFVSMLDKNFYARLVTKLSSWNIK